MLIPGDRTLIIGNSGSGKSTLAALLASRSQAPVIDLDALHWEAGGVGKKRDEGKARQSVAAAAAQERWIIEGVYGWLAAVAANRATCFIWLDLSWTSCREGLAARGMRRGATPADFDALLNWAEAYWQRTSPSSFSGHLAMFEKFVGHKVRLRSRLEVDEFSRTLP